MGGLRLTHQPRFSAHVMVWDTKPHGDVVDGPRVRIAAWKRFGQGVWSYVANPYENWAYAES